MSMVPLRHLKTGKGEHLALTPAQTLLRKMVLDSASSPHSRRNYAKALDDLFRFCASRPLSRELLMEWRSTLESLSPSTINVRLSAVRKMFGEARRAGMIGQEEAASLMMSRIFDRMELQPNTHYTSIVLHRRHHAA